MEKSKKEAPSSNGAAENVKGKVTMERYINPYTDFDFEKLFEQAEIAKYSESERRRYEESKKEYWDYFSTMKTAEEKGVIKEKQNTARKMKTKGYEIADIADITGLTAEEIEQL